MDDMSLVANFPTGRRDHSRSPPKQAFHNDPRGRDSHYRDDDLDYDYDHDHDHDYDGRPGHYEDGYTRRTGASREARPNARDAHDYRGMYDDGYVDNNDQGRRRHENDKYRSNRGRYRDNDDPQSQSPSGSYHNHSRSDSPTREAGKPSDTVILEGLPFSISSNELRDSILSNPVAAEFPSIEVRISASKGNRRAFVQFQEVDHAVAFMREHYPKLLVEMAHSTDDVPEGKFDAYIHYARSRDARDETDVRGLPGSSWMCPTCDFSNYSTRVKCKICGGPQAAPAWQLSLTGMADASDVPAQILVIYPLASFVTEDMLASDMKRLELVKPETPKDTSNGAPKLKSTAPTGDTTGYGARPGSLHRVFLMRDANTNESFKYGFAEFWTVEDATAALTKFHKFRSFTVAACPATVSSTHMGVFLPEEREVTPEIEHMSFNPLFNLDLRVRYRDYHVYPCQQIVTEQPPEGDATSKGTEEEGNDKKSKKRKAEGSLAASSTKKSVPMMAGQMAMWQRKRDELRVEKELKPARQNKAEFSDVNRTPLRINLSGSGADATKPQNAIKISISGTKVGAPELATPSKQASPEEADTPGSTAQPLSVPEEAIVSYVDRDRLMCLICMRKYKSVDEVNIHEKSRNHKTAMENEEQVKAALPRLAARDKRIQKQLQDNPDTAAAASQYRDRAKERRAAFNQPTKPTTAPQSKPKSASKSGEAAPAAKPTQSKGAGMLAKMGWSTGAGLGANGDGRTEVIETNAYQEGVGLGADGGNLGDAAQLAERKTKNSYADYVNTVQDKARERYNKLG
ncbi:RNA binding motif-containing protein [Fusarium heterosporum]|uniref:RNA binding motif-containing protein n=1 Tax=Fusarium heterosporum TaxID=42747 RepID=A0A8H5WUK3_FUSHE|nr:RNA binding motif-containing protein [Fusarium heterosporum]